MKSISNDLVILSHEVEMVRSVLIEKLQNANEALKEINSISKENNYKEIEDIVSSCLKILDEPLNDEEFDSLGFYETEG